MQPAGRAPGGLYWQASSTRIPEQGFAGFVGTPGYNSAMWGLGVHDVPEDVSLTAGCGGGTWRWTAAVNVFRSPNQYFFMDCSALPNGGPCRAWSYA